jgi:hypothetical protein
MALLYWSIISAAWAFIIWSYAPASIYYTAAALAALY